MQDVSSSAEIIDSRDIETRITELEGLSKEADFLDYEREELEALKQLREDVTHPEWRYGVTLIRDSYFKEYAENVAGEIGAINPDAQWPLNCIDWDEAAEQLRADYSPVEYDGVTYWCRN